MSTREERKGILRKAFESMEVQKLLDEEARLLREYRIAQELKNRLRKAKDRARARKWYTPTKEKG